jgi:hypothetical protein
MALSNNQHLRKAVAKMWQFHNPNPKGKSVGDCTIRAIGIATDKGWMETYLDLCLFGLLMADMPSANAITTAYLKKQGFQRKTIPETCPDCYSVKDFCEDHKEGVYVLGTGSHMVAVIDGNYYDAWDSGDEIPVYYFHKK